MSPKTFVCTHLRWTRLRTILVAALAVATNAVGNLLLSLGVKGEALLQQLSPLAYVKLLVNPYVVAGILLLLVWFGSRLLLFSWADLSYVVPVTALGYVAAALGGKLFLNEVVSYQRWLACGLIFVGSLLVGITPQRTIREVTGTRRYRAEK